MSRAHERVTSITGRQRLTNRYGFRFPCLRVIHGYSPEETRFEVTTETDAGRLIVAEDEALKRADGLVQPPLPLRAGQVKIYLPGGDVESRLHKPTVDAFRQFMDKQGVPTDSWSMEPEPASVGEGEACFVADVDRLGVTVATPDDDRFHVSVRGLVAAGGRLMLARTIQDPRIAANLS